MKKINFQKWKRAVMPEDFNLLQTNIEEDSENRNKNLIGYGIVTGGGMGISGAELVIDPFYAITQKGQEVKLDSAYSVSIENYINTDRYVSVVAKKSKTFSGTEQDIDNNNHHYLEIDGALIVLKEDNITFPLIASDEVLLKDIRFYNNGSYAFTEGRVVRLIKMQDTVLKQEVIQRDTQTLQSANQYTDQVAQGFLSIVALENISFENLVKNGNFYNSDTTNWTILNNATATVTTDEYNKVSGFLCRLTRNHLSGKEVLTQIIDDDAIVGRQFSFRGLLKMEAGQNGGGSFVIKVLNASNSVIATYQTDIVTENTLTKKTITFTVPENARKIALFVEIEVNANTIYIGELSAQYSNVATQFQTSTKDILDIANSYTDNLIQNHDTQHDDRFCQRANNLIDLHNIVAARNNLDVYSKAEIDAKIMPVGSIYVQYPQQSAPASLFGGVWQNVSALYAGDFFRAEGGAANTFESGRQGDAIRNITGSLTGIGSHDEYGIISSGAFTHVIQNPNTGGGTASYTAVNSISFDASRVVPTAAENRPVNQTVRIWKRIA